MANVTALRTEYKTLMSTLTEVANKGKVNEGSVKSLKTAVESGLVEENLSTTRPWRLTNSGCKKLTRHILQTAEVADSKVLH